MGLGGYTFACLWVCVLVRLHVCGFVGICAYLCVFACTRAYGLNTRSNALPKGIKAILLRLSVCACVYLYVFVCICVYLFAFAFSCLCLHIFVCVFASFLPALYDRVARAPCDLRCDLMLGSTACG